MLYFIQRQDIKSLKSLNGNCQSCPKNSILIQSHQVRDAEGAHRLQAGRGQPQEGHRRQPDLRRAADQRDMNVIQDQVTNQCYHSVLPDGKI